MHPRNFRPANRYKAILADRLQRLGDALRLSSKSPEAALAYKEAETLALEVLQTHPNQLDTQLILHLIRRGSSLIATVSPKQDIVSTFGQGLGRFRFGMSVREVSGLLSRRDLATQRVPEYKSGNVQFFWMPMAAFEDVTEIYNKHCVGGSDYVAFMFHNDSLFRISLRFWGGVRGCDDRRFFFHELALKFGMPVYGPARQPRLLWEAGKASIIGTMHNATAPMLDLVAR